MATPKVAPAEIARNKACIEKCLKEGFAPVGFGGSRGSAIEEAARRLCIGRSTLASRLHNGSVKPNWKLYKERKITLPKVEMPQPPPPLAVSATLIHPAAFKLLKQRPATVDELAITAGLSEPGVREMLREARLRGLNIREVNPDVYTLEQAPASRPPNAPAAHTMVATNGCYEFGFVTDTHLGSKYERMDVLNDLYDRFERRGITQVMHAGNWVEGEISFNRYDIHTHGMDAQLQYLVENYPQRKGIETYCVVGDDHEGWWAKREGIDVGLYAQNKFRDAGRTDWHYLGYMEADIKLEHDQTGAWSIGRLVHPGGGSAYAISYSVQKMVESYEGGDKPAVVLCGHYHKMEILNYRNTWIIQGGCTKDQDPFMRKKKLEAHIGGLIVRLEQDPRTGAIIACNDMYRYFNKGYYDQANARWSMSGAVVKPERSLGGV